MLQEILQSKQSKLQLKKKLKVYVDAVTKNPPQLQKDLQSDKLSQISHKLTSISFGLTIDLIFNGLSLQECLGYVQHPQQNQTDILKLLNFALQENIPEKYLKFSAALDRHSGLEKALAILSGFTKYCIKNTNEGDLPKLIPRFIRICSFIIQKYLTLKNQPAKDSEDRLACDRIILKNCEAWVSGSIKQFFKCLVVPVDPTIKQCTIFGICDLIGAILELLKEKTLQVEILTNLLDQVLVPYFTKTYSYQEVYKTFLTNLQQNHYNNPQEKIQIPEKYEFQTSKNLNTQAFSYLTYNHLIKCSFIYSDRQILKYITLATSQILPRHHEIKEKLIVLLMESLERNGGFLIEDGSQLNYPIGLLFFNFWNYEKEHYESLRKYIKVDDEQVLINILVQLKLLGKSTAGAEQNEFILNTLNSQKLVSSRILIVLRQIANEGLLNSTASELYAGICSNLINSNHKQKTLMLVNQLKKRNKIDDKLSEKINSFKI